MVHSAIRRAILLVLLCCGGAVCVVWLSGAWTRIPVEDHRYHTFQPASSALPRTAHLAGVGSTVNLPDPAWRPLTIAIVLQAPAARTPVTLAINNDVVARVTAGREPQLVTVTYAGRPAPGGALVLNVSPDAADAVVGVLSLDVTPEVSRQRLWGMLATGVLLGAFVWSLTGVRSAAMYGAAAALALAAAIAAATTFGTGPLAGGVAESAGMWTSEAARVTALLFLLLFPGWFLLDAAADDLPPLLRENIPLLMLPVTALILSVLAVVLEVVQAPNGGFFITCSLLYGLGTALAVSDAGRRARLWRLIRSERALLLLPLLVSICAILYASVGVPSLDAIDDWPRLANRDLHALPGDNGLSWLASQTWRFHLPANALYGDPWRIGDRGPLYALIHLFLSRGIELQSPTFSNYTRLGIVLNALFIMPVFVWLSSLMGRRVAWWCAALVALNPWFFLNIYFTWPKLLSAYFALTAMWLLWRRPAPESPRVFAAAGTLFGLSTLAHAGGMLSLPAFLTVTALVFVRSRRALLRLLLVPAMFGIVVLPWQLYKQWYAPETYNLFYLHYLDGKGYFTPLSENVARFAKEHPPSEQIAVRLEHLRELWWGTIDLDLIRRFWTGRDVGLRLYLNEFFSPWYTAGILWFVWIVAVLPVAFALRLILGGALTSRAADWFCAPWRSNAERPLWPVVVFIALSLTLNEALRWGRPFSHELPYLELIALAVLLVVAMARLGWAWLVFPALAIVLRHAFYFIQSATTSVDDLPAMDMAGRLYWMTLAAILLLVCRSRLFAGDAEPVPADAQP